MGIRFCGLALAISAVLAPSLSDAATRVRGYYRKDGTYVAPHYRSSPNSSKSDNWSTRGNVNPYTGEAGTQNPYSLPSLPSYPSYPTYPAYPSYPVAPAYPRDPSPSRVEDATALQAALNQVEENLRATDPRYESIRPAFVNRIRALVPLLLTMSPRAAAERAAQEYLTLVPAGNLPQQSAPDACPQASAARQGLQLAAKSIIDCTNADDTDTCDREVRDAGDARDALAVALDSCT